MVLYDHSLQIKYCDRKKGKTLTIGCWSKTLRSKSPCSQNSAATIRAT